MGDGHGQDARIRVVVQQPALPKYRVPVFRELASRPGIDLMLYYAALPHIRNLKPEGFAGEHVPMWHRELMGHPIYWHRPQWDHATRQDSDVQILSWDLHYASLVPSLLRAKAHRVGTVLWGHGISKHEARWRAFPRHKVAGLATALLLYNRTVARHYVELGFDPASVFVALDALDQAPIQAARQWWLDRPEELAAFRRQQSLEMGPNIIFVSRLEPDNRLDLLLKAAPALLSRHPGLKIMIVGKGGDENRLRALADALDLVGRVIFAGAIYDEMKLAPWMLSSDVFAYPVNMGLSVLHAFGYGLPVVTSDRLELHGPEIEALRPGVNGLLYRHGDIDALAETLSGLLADEQRRQRMSAEAHRTATQEFSLKNMVDGMEAAIRFAARSVRLQ